MLKMRRNDIITILSTLIFFMSVFVDVFAQDSNFENLNQRSVKISLGVIAGFAIGVGIFLMLLGWRFFKLNCFIIGMILGFMIGFWAVIAGVSDKEEWAPWVAIGVGIALGLIIGIIMFCSPVIGVLLMGATIGFAIGSLVYTFALARTGFRFAYFIAVGVGAILGGLISLCIKKPLVILVTSFIGAYEVCWGVGYFAGTFPGGYASLSSSGTNNPNGQGTPYQWFIYLAAIIIGTIIGIFVQSKITGKDFTWDDMKHGRLFPKKNKFDDSMSVPLVEEESSRKKKKKGKKKKKKKDEDDDYTAW